MSIPVCRGCRSGFLLVVLVGFPSVWGTGGGRGGACGAGLGAWWGVIGAWDTGVPLGVAGGYAS